MTKLDERLKTSLKKILRRLDLEVTRPHDDYDWQFRRFTEALLESRRREVGEDFFFVQLGANDGVSFDHFYEYATFHRLSGLVVEPVSTFFDELCRNYHGQPQVKPVRSAIHATANEIQIYRVREDAPNYAQGLKGIASTDPDHHKRSSVDPHWMVAEIVPCMTWLDLIRQNDVKHLDYLQIDTEGYDAEILDMVIDQFLLIKPHIIKFEHYMEAGVMSAEVLSNLFRSLTKMGYFVLVGRYDAIAHLRG